MKRSAKRGLSWLLSLLMLVTMLPLGSVDTWAQETDETVPDGVTYIATKEELSAVRENPAGQYVLTQDIVFTPDDFEEGGAFYNDGAGWEPIGTRDVPFTGTFDGNGHTIEGLEINRCRAYTGLFGYVENGWIEDLYAKDITVQGNSYGIGQAWIGGIAGYLNGGVISGCAVSGSLSVKSYRQTEGMGGLAGGIDEASTITQCYNQATITGTLVTGGITALAGGTISSCYNVGVVTSVREGGEVGAIAGYVDSEGVTGCYYLNNMDRGAGGGPDTAIACTQEEMAQAETFSLFDFDVFWFMEEGAAYPQLRALSGVAPKKQVTELTIVSLPDQREYRYEMSDSMHLEGGQIQLTFQDGTQKIMPMASAIVTGLELNQEGVQTLTVSYAGCMDTFTVNVTSVYPQYLEIESLPKKTRYLLHAGEKVDVTGGQIRVNMNNGSHEIVDMTPDMITGFDDSTPGTNTLTVSYAWGWAETTFDVTICEENTTEFAGGIGTDSYPYKISTKEQLDRVREYLDASFVMTDDLVFTPDDFAEGGAFYNSGAGWDSIGSGSLPFTGTFDGNGHTIKGLYQNYVKSVSRWSSGLFGDVQGGRIQRLGLIDGSITTKGGTAGGLAGQLLEESVIQDCFYTGLVTGASTSGGLVGYMTDNSAVLRSYQSGTVLGEDQAGGIAGLITMGKISDCYQTGFVSAKNKVGGIAGSTEWKYIAGQSGPGNVITNCYQIGTIHPYSTDTQAGGLVGELYWVRSQIENCYYNSSMERESGNLRDVGGKCSGEEMKQASNFQSFDFETVWDMGPEEYPFPVLRQLSLFTGDATENVFDGGVGAEAYPYEISTKEQLSRVREYPDCSFILTQDIVFTPDDFEEGGAFYNGGAGWEPIGTQEVPFTGTFDGNGHTIKGLTVMASSSQDRVYAGLFGYVSGTVQDIRLLTGTVMAENGGSFAAYAGSVAGFLDGGTVSGCHSDMKVTARSLDGYVYAGGITGYMQNGSTITACRQGGTVQVETGDDRSGYAGGIVGVVTGQRDIVSICLNTGTVTAGASEQGTGNQVSDMHAGGIVGLLSWGTAENVFNMGPVRASGLEGYAGGLAGYSNGQLQNGYNVGQVEATSKYYYRTYAGGIAGYVASTPATNCYYLDIIDRGAGTSSSVCDLTACTSQQMQTAETFRDFDFDSVWILQESGYLYPQLRGIETVYEPAPQYLLVTRLPDQTVYMEGTDSLDLTGGQVTLIYNDGNAEVIDLTEDMVSGFDNRYPGERTLRVTYAGLTTTFSVTVKEITSLQTPSVSLTNSTDGVKISWNAIPYAQRYNIYRRTPSSGWFLMTNVTDTSYIDTTTESGTTYYYTVRARYDDVLSDYVSDQSILYLARPSVSLTNGTSGVTISWGKVTGASGYYVYRRVSALDSWTRIKNTTGTSFTDTEAKAGTTYYYTVKAYAGSSNSTYRTDCTIRRLTRPSVSLTNGTSGVTISWGKVSGATSYNVYRRTTSGGWSQIKNVTGTSYTDTSAKAGTTYYYTVRARYGNTLSAYVTDKSIRRLTRPSVSLTNSTSGVKISWGKVTGATSYNVYRRTTSGGWSQIKNVTGTSYTDTSAKAGTTYYYTVRARYGDTLSAYVTDKSIRRLTRPSVSLTNGTSGVKISWGKVTGATSYNVYRRTTSGDWSQIKNVTGTSYTDTSAKAGTTYYYTVRARYGNTLSAYVTDKSIRRLTRPSVSLTNSTSGVKISWGKVTGATSYNVYRRTTSGDWSQIKNVTGTSYTDTSAKAGTTYYYTVRARYGNTLSAYVTDKSIRRLTRPSVSLSKTSTGVKISWGKVSGASGYYVYRRTTSGSWTRIKNTTGTSFTDTGAKKGVTYYYTVKAYAGSSYSTYVTDKSIRR